jgi:ketosteroid isomerase-like protein
MPRTSRLLPSTPTPDAPPTEARPGRPGAGRRRAATALATLALPTIVGGLGANPAHAGWPEGRRDDAGAAAARTDSLPSVDVPAEFARVLGAYERAWRARDAGALAALFTEDGVVLPSGGPPVRGRDAIRALYAPQAGGPLHLRAFAYGREGNTGYVLGAFRYAAAGPDEGKFTLTLRRAPGGEWRIHSDMDSPDGRRPADARPPAGPPHPGEPDTVRQALRAAIDRDVWRPYLDGVRADRPDLYVGVHAREFYWVAPGDRGLVMSRDEYEADSRAVMARRGAAGVATSIEVRFLERNVRPDFAAEKTVTRVIVRRPSAAPDTSYGIAHVFSRPSGGTWRVVLRHGSRERASAATFLAAEPPTPR